jgi:hypothetical protein
VCVCVTISNLLVAQFLEGVCLIVAYVIISVAYYYRVEPPAQSMTSVDCVCGTPCCGLPSFKK